ncbi:MAG TPA: BON domain-containing protein [Longimicrobiales bacterium]|nr:BON domain-containing protein [Longimicrobiales bacterium]
MFEGHRNEALAMVAGIGLGAALMYFIDPQRGTARRTQVIDQAAGTLRSARRDAEVVGRNLRNRARGAAAEIRNHVRREDVDDVQLEERVRAELGHHSHSSLRRVEVHADQGYVTLSGLVAPEDHNDVVRAARHVHGVEDVRDDLRDAHDR